MAEVPNRFKCAYCIRNSRHGGECSDEAYDGCLFFKMDERGCIRNSDFEIRFPLYHKIPLLKTWCDYWQMCGVDTEIKIKWINGLEWDTKTGELIVHCNCDYFINEYSDDYVETKEKPKLEILKGGKEK